MSCGREEIRMDELLMIQSTMKILRNDKLTVHVMKLPLCTSPNWKACGAANRNAKIQMAKMNLITLDNLDIVWDLKKIGADGILTLKMKHCRRHHL